MESLAITVVCVFGMVSGHLLKNSIEHALAAMNVTGISISVRNMDGLEASPRIVLCNQTLCDAIRRRNVSDKVYGVSSVLDEVEVRAKLMEALEQCGYKGALAQQTTADKRLSCPSAATSL